jgi:pre-mRNA-splicing factor ATP-dependent RNA helicase DHX16
MAALNTWVRDQLIDILGYSESSIVDFVVAIAKKNNNDLNKFLDSLKNCDVPVNDKTKRFAVELLGKVPRSSQPVASQVILFV